MSHWQTTNNVNAYTRFPAAAAVYVVYVDSSLYYVGSTNNLDVRMRSSWCRKDKDPHMREATIDIKFSLSIKYGDWLMKEARLIQRLGPRANVINNPKIKHTFVQKIRVRKYTTLKKREHRPL